MEEAEGEAAEVPRDKQTDQIQQSWVHSFEAAEEVEVGEEAEGSEALLMRVPGHHLC